MPIISMTARYRPTPMKIIVSVLNARPLIFVVDRPVCGVQLTIRSADVLPADQAVYSNSGTSGHVPRFVEGVRHSGRAAIRVINDCWRCLPAWLSYAVLSALCNDYRRRSGKSVMAAVRHHLPRMDRKSWRRWHGLLTACQPRYTNCSRIVPLCSRAFRTTCGHR